MRFKQFLEAKKTPEPNWADDYQSGLSMLRDMQSSLTQVKFREQLFVPKRRDPAKLEKIKRDRAWAQIKKEFPDEVKEETIPILTTFKEQPPGNNKPDSAFWTSSAIKKSNGTYTSDWYKFVQRTFPEWQTDYGYLFEVDASALVLESDYLDRFYQWTEFTDKFTKKMDTPQYSGYSNFSANLRMSVNYPWDTLARHFDGVHHSFNSWDSEAFTRGWDVESTAWFNTKFLKYKGAVPLYHED